MPQDNRNIYKTARQSAGYSQEQAAELLEISVESVRAYETGQRVPPDQTVAVMARRYDTPWLKLEHARLTDELGIFPRGVRRRTLAQAALHLLRLWRELGRHEQRLMEIAEDGSVDADEAEDYDTIDAFVGSFVAACLELQCCEGAKKERPEGGASKRSAFQEKPRTTVTGIISQSPRNASTICAGEAVNAL